MCLKTTKARWTRRCHLGQNTTEATINQLKLQRKNSVKTGVAGGEGALFKKLLLRIRGNLESHVHPQGRTSAQKRPKNRGVTTGRN